MFLKCGHLLPSLISAQMLFSHHISKCTINPVAKNAKMLKTLILKIHPSLKGPELCQAGTSIKVTPGSSSYSRSDDLVTLQNCILSD